MWRVCLSLLLQIVPFAHAQCSVPSKAALHGHSPVFLGFNNLFKYPNPRKSINDLEFEWYEDRLLYCPGGSLSMTRAGQPDTPLDGVASSPYILPPIVRCLKDDKFVLHHDSGYVQDVTLDQFKCSDYPQAISYYQYEGSAPKVCSTVNGNNGVLVNLGFVIDLPAEKGLIVIQVCYEEARATTIWSHHLLAPGALGRVVFKNAKNEALKWDFEPGQVFQGLNMKNIYRACTQTEAFSHHLRDSVRESLGFKDDNGNPITDERMLRPNQLAELKEMLKDEVEQYIYWNNSHQAGNSMLAKGHLAPRGDFFYLVEERSTFFFSNALPMWYSINGGHWVEMEKWVRKLAAKKVCHLDVWTGGLKTMKIRGKEVYMGRRYGSRGKSKNLLDKGTPVVPVPKVLFKIVRCEALNEAIVFLAINDPLLDVDSMDAEDPIHCLQEYDLCKQLKPHWSSASNTRRGFMYCCEYHSFMNHPYAQEIAIPVERVRPDVMPLIRDASDLL